MTGILPLSIIFIPEVFFLKKKSKLHLDASSFPAYPYDLPLKKSIRRWFTFLIWFLSIARLPSSSHRRRSREEREAALLSRMQLARGKTRCEATAVDAVYTRGDCVGGVGGGVGDNIGGGLNGDERRVALHLAVVGCLARRTTRAMIDDRWPTR